MSYLPGQRVRVSAREHAGHHRTPSYVKGRTGTIARVQGSFADPETRAYGGDGLPERRLFLVGFTQDEVWEHARGAASDQVYVDLFEHWLESPE
jgi:hypothetical protein